MKAKIFLPLRAQNKRNFSFCDLRVLNGKKNVTILVILLLSYTLSLAAQQPTVDGIAAKLSCYCGTCPHLAVSMCTCSKADEIKSEIKQMIGQGMSEQQIIQAFIAEHGETVLAAPPRSGFSLTAWMLPFLAFLAGGFVLFTFLKRQQKPPDDPPPANSPHKSEKSETDEQYRQRLNDELEERK